MPDAANIPAIVHPDKIELQGRRAKCGPKVFSLLKLVLTPKGRVTFGRLARAVFGERDVERGKVDVLVHRANAKLENVHCPLRLTVDGERVLLV